MQNGLSFKNTMSRVGLCYFVLMLVTQALQLAKDCGSNKRMHGVFSGLFAKEDGGYSKSYRFVFTGTC